MAAYGVPEEAIARVVGIDAKTLRKHYRDELDTGATKATARVAEFLYRKATSDGPQCVTAAIFWLKTRGHWKESGPEVSTVAPRLIVSWLGGPNGDGAEEQMIMAPPPIIEHE